MGGLNQVTQNISQDQSELPIDHKRRRGSLTVEATISLTAFLFMFMMIYSIVNICRTQAIMGAALQNTAKEISQYTYLYSITGLHEGITDALDAPETSVTIDELSTGITGAYDNIMQLNKDGKQFVSDVTETDLSNLVTNVSGDTSKLEEDMKLCQESAHNVSETLEQLADDPKSFMIGLAKIGASEGMTLAKSKLITPAICRGFIKKHFKFSEGQTTEEFLKELRIVPKDGATGVSFLNGLDFTNSSLFATKDYDIVLRVKYEIQVVPWLPVDIKLTLCQTAITRGWADGDGRHLTFDDPNKKVEERVKGSFKEEPIPATPAAVTASPEEQTAVDNFLASVPPADKDKYNFSYLVKMYRVYGEDAFSLMKEQGIDAYLALKTICSQTKYQKAVTPSNVKSVVTCIINTMKESEGKQGTEYIKKNIANDTQAILNQIVQYGDDAIKVITDYGEDGYYITACYGQEGIDYLKKNKKEGVDFILYFGDEWKDKVGIADFAAYKKVVVDNGKGAIDDICKAYPEEWKKWNAEDWENYIKKYSEEEKEGDESGSKSDLLDNTGKFLDESIEADYQKYVSRKINEGKTPRGREDWKETRDYWLNDSPMARGNDFNKTAVKNKWYPFNEINLENGKRLDSYNPDTKEIVSRKATDLENIDKSTFESYLKELNDKYSSGTKIRSNKYPEIDGLELQGQQILEIPECNKEFNKIDEYIHLAKEKYNIEIRFRKE